MKKLLSHYFKEFSKKKALFLTFSRPFILAEKEGPRPTSFSLLKNKDKNPLEEEKLLYRGKITFCYFRGFPRRCIVILAVVTLKIDNSHEQKN